MVAIKENDHYRSEARHEWRRARRKARWEEMGQKRPGEHTQLHDFNDIAHRLNLRHAVYLGVQNVPLESIVGSVGRYKDFTTAFLPGDDGLQDRWERIATIYLDPTSGGVPPVDLVKVGASYFVKDGNHRVSVARQLDFIDIEAYVWEHRVSVPDVPADADIDELLLEAERREFLEHTDLDTLRPGHSIILTAPGGYGVMLAQIAKLQEALCQIDERSVPWHEAVTDWYDMLYETSIQAIQNDGLLKLFPNRTEADFFVWVRRHQQELEERYDRRVRLTDAARSFKRVSKPGLPTRTFRAALRVLAAFSV